MFINTTQFLSIASSQSLNNALQVSRHMMNQHNQRGKSHNTNLKRQEVETPTHSVEVKKKQEVIDICTPLGIELPENFSNQENFNCKDNSAIDKVDNIPQVTINALEELKSVMKKCKDLRVSQNTTSASMKNEM